VFASQFNGYLLLFPVLFCGGGMALCMWLMSHGSHKNSSGANEDTHGPDQNARIAALEAQVNRLQHDVEPKREVRPVGSDGT